jgi:hypothetical protein
MILRTCISLLLLISSGAAQAEPTKIDIPGQGWSITFESPVLTKVKESNVPEQYMYFGNANRFNLSLYVETPRCEGGHSHEAFLKCFWQKASTNPLIKKDTVRTSCNDRYCKIVYDVEANIRGTQIRQRNVNLLFAYREKWTDVHASIVNPNEEDLNTIENVATSLSYGEVQ